MAGGVVLIGLMGAGKTQVGHQLAAALGWPFLDLDERIQQQAGCPVQELFARGGEASFRQLELEILQELAAEVDPHPVVLATGGGTPCQAAAWPALRRVGRVVWLQVSPAQAAARLRTSLGEVSQRPLLAGGADLAETLARLLSQRQREYARADWVVSTDDRSPAEVAAAIQRWLCPEGASNSPASPAWSAWPASERAEEVSPSGRWDVDRTLWVELGAHRYPVHIGVGLLAHVGRILADSGAASSPPTGSAGAVVVITNPTVRALHGQTVQASLEAARLHAVWLEMPDGERYKRLPTLARLYEEAAERGVERGWPVLALGGGVVGDTAGLFAATFLRGLPLIQVPTTLLAQVDASVGGKVAVDLAAGKNLVGAFYQPRLVLIDPSVLATLPARQVRTGWAEVVKTAALAGGDLAARLDQIDATTLAHPGGDSLWPELVAACVEFKAQVVAADEREESGRRAILNLGHTVGHALERVTGYERYTHGEAVAIGLEMALRLSTAYAGLPVAQAERVRRWLTVAGLPLGPEQGRWPTSWPLLQAALARDKKVVGGQIHWVLLRGVGEPVQQVLSWDAVEQALTARSETWREAGGGHGSQA